MPGALLFFQAPFVEERSLKKDHSMTLIYLDWLLFHWMGQKTSGWTLEKPSIIVFVEGCPVIYLNVEAFLSIQGGCKSNPLLCVSMVAV